MSPRSIDAGKYSVVLVKSSATPLWADEATKRAFKTMCDEAKERCKIFDECCKVTTSFSIASLKEEQLILMENGQNGWFKRVSV